MPLLRLGPVIAGVFAVVGDLHARPACFVVGVGQRDGEIEEEGAVFVAVDERERFVSDEVVAVLDLLRGDAAAEVAVAGDDVLERDAFFVPHKEGRVVVVGVVLVEVAVEFI